MKTSIARHVARLSTVASFALAALPMAALSTVAHAQGAPQRVHVSDLNLASASGKAAFAQRADTAARKLCSGERNLTLNAACQDGVRTEANEKITSATQFASR